MAARKLRAVTEAEVQVVPPSLLEAVESGDILAIMKAQRRLIAESLVTASDNTRPQYSNELSKLNKQISDEESRRAIDDADASVVVDLEASAWDGTGY